MMSSIMTSSLLPPPTPTPLHPLNVLDGLLEAEGLGGGVGESDLEGQSFEELFGRFAQMKGKIKRSEFTLYQVH